MHNSLHYGDNLDILPSYVKDESVDLVYLAPFQLWDTSIPHGISEVRQPIW